METEGLSFSLDIGTRSVVGIVSTHQDGAIKIIDYEIAEHKKRSMYDGQIHDIESVIYAVKEVKDCLEKRLQVKFNNVSIAAAGRSLKTARVKVERDLDNLSYVDKDVINTMEIEAVQKAQKESDNHEDGAEYYCVGYAVVNYFLNGAVITKLEGHRGNSIGVEVIATFLPKVVVDSLYFVINMTGLTVSSMTLEPIAALNVSIQDSFKLLNIALVDIGAGTSDIALTKDGTVFAFAMAPIAGDEITERISQDYLLDFDTAERVKKSLSKESIIEFQDIMDYKQQIGADIILEKAMDSIKVLANEITSRILKYNGKSPSAVFLIGGGSCIPNISDLIADNLNIPRERVGVRKTDIIKDVMFDNSSMEGPEFITPIGIAVLANAIKERDFLTVTVNNKIVKLLNAKRITVADALIFVAYNPKDLIGRRGLDVNYILNGKDHIQKGGLGKAAIIKINGVTGSLDTKIENGDEIQIEPSVDGENASLKIEELLNELPFIEVRINGLGKAISPFISVNGKKSDNAYYIKEGDEIFYSFPNTISQLIDYLSVSKENLEIYINDVKGTEESKFYIQDKIEINNIVKTAEEIKEELEKDKNRIIIWVNDEEIEMHDRKDYMFLDIFNYIDFNTDKAQGDLILKINNRPANYADVINDGDRIELRWI